MKTFAQYIHGTQSNLLAHTVRTRLYDTKDPLLEATFAEGTVYPFEYEKRRVGRPRESWTWNTYRRMATINTHATHTTFKSDPKGYIDMMVPRIDAKFI